MKTNEVEQNNTVKMRQTGFGGTGISLISGLELMTGFCEYGNGHWGSIHGRELPDLRKDYQILMGFFL
jgi:hypothetical protein